jgi:hypothetical protein
MLTSSVAGVNNKVVWSYDVSLKRVRRTASCCLLWLLVLPCPGKQAGIPSRCVGSEPPSIVIAFKSRLASRHFRLFPIIIHECEYTQPFSSRALCEYRHIEDVVTVFVRLPTPPDGIKITPEARKVEIRWCVLSQSLMEWIRCPNYCITSTTIQEHRR